MAHDFQLKFPDVLPDNASGVAGEFLDLNLVRIFSPFQLFTYPSQMFSIDYPEYDNTCRLFPVMC